jgi:hypothetical protein
MSLASLRVDPQRPRTIRLSRSARRLGGEIGLDAAAAGGGVLADVEDLAGTEDGEEAGTAPARFGKRGGGDDDQPPRR